MPFYRSIVPALLLAATCFGQQPSTPPAPTHILSDADVAAAIERGYRKPHSVGTELLEGGTACNTCPTSGFQIVIYNPAQWIEQAAMKAKRELNSFTIANVTPEMRQPVLHVVAWPDLPNTAGGMASASNVNKVVLSDLAKQMLVQPLSNDAEAVPVDSAFRTATFNKAVVTFSMADVAKVRGPSGDGEFYIMVAGDTHTKDFKVKAKVLSHIF